MIKRWPYHVVATRRHQDKPRTKGLNDKLRACWQMMLVEFARGDGG
jgi:hypothetical protein